MWRGVVLCATSFFQLILCNARMAHLVSRRGYFSLEESYRDERGRPRKRYLAYLGRYSIDWRATLASEVQGVDWDAIEREEAARVDAEEKAYQAKLAHLPSGLRVGPVDPVPVERQTPCQSVDSTQSASSSVQTDTFSSASSNEPDADPGSDDASGSSSLE